jgi:membrane protein DedA with SNARE-associated domain
MYYVGEYLGENLIRKGKFKFLKKDSLEKTDEWFSKYGYNLILINRFIPGTRAVISFFCGVHRLKPAKTFLFAALSSFVWNVLLISLGIALGNNIEMIDRYLGTYSNIGLGITAIILGFFLYKYWKKKKTK